MKRSVLFVDVCVCAGAQQEVASKYILRIVFAWAGPEPRLLPALLTHACSLGQQRWSHMGISGPLTDQKLFPAGLNSLVYFIPMLSQLFEQVLHAVQFNQEIAWQFLLGNNQKIRHKMVQSEKSPTPNSWSVPRGNHYYQFPVCHSKDILCTNILFSFHQKDTLLCILFCILV